MNNSTTIINTDDQCSYLVNYKNYFMYAKYISNRSNIMNVYVPGDIAKENISDHIDAITAILKDGIDEEYVHNLKVRVSWEGNISCDLYVIDYWFGLFMWSMLVKIGTPIRPKHIFWSENLKRINIKLFIDDFILTKENKERFGNDFLNSTICDALSNFNNIEIFSYYLANTINNEDDIELMKRCPEFKQLYHISLADVPFDKVKDEGMKATNRAIDIIVNDSRKYLGHQHCLENSFRSSEAINPRQYKEARHNIGTKPDGEGNIFPKVIDTNFSIGGVVDPVDYFIESSAARLAQILSKTNVGDSGDFARLLGLNNTDTFLNLDKDYECMSQHFIKYEIKTERHLSMINNRYYRLNPKGMQYIINSRVDKDLIGKTIYLKSPITCASKSSGNGVCKCCYGNLYYTNRDINIGKMAAEILSSKLTQILLSAKHLLESRVISMNWLPSFYDYFDVIANSIKLVDTDGMDTRKYHLIIDPDDVILENEESDTIIIDEDGNEIQTEDISYNEYVTRFYIQTPNGQIITCGTTDSDSLYISRDLNEIIRRKSIATDGKVSIPFSALGNGALFYIKIYNNEISKTMNDIISTINKASVTESLSKDELLQRLVDLVVDGGININSVHLEVILSNQIVDKDNILSRPNWNNPNAEYRVFTLDHALVNNPSIIVSLLYKDLHRVLCNPLSFTKNAPSFFDLFFCEQPQVYMSENLYTDTTDIRDYDKGIEMVKIIDDKK